jgi:hypothetical protein
MEFEEVMIGSKKILSREPEEENTLGIQPLQAPLPTCSSSSAGRLAPVMMMPGMARMPMHVVLEGNEIATLTPGALERARTFHCHHGC